MLLNALAKYYDRLVAAGHAATGEVNISSGAPSISPLWYMRRGITNAVEIDLNGELVNIRDLREVDDKGKKSSRNFIIPGIIASRASAVLPQLLWDNSTYLFGFPNLAAEKNNPLPPDEKSLKALKLTVEYHLKHEPFIGDPHYSAACRFLEKQLVYANKVFAHNEANRTKLQFLPGDAPVIRSLYGSMVIAVVDEGGRSDFTYTRPKVEAYVRTHYRAVAHMKAPSLGDCAVSGDKGVPIAAIHNPAIVGLGDRMGVKLCSACDPAQWSYQAKGGGTNIAISEETAFKYATALNYLLEDVDRSLILGDMRVVFWAEAPNPTIEDGVMRVADPRFTDSVSTTEQELKALLKTALTTPSQSGASSLDATFYVAGLKASQKRGSVKFVYRDTLGHLLENFRQHFADLKLVGANMTYAPRRLVEPIKDKAQREIMADQLVHAAISGERYPVALLQNALARCRVPGLESDFDVPVTMVAVIKAYLNRLFRERGQKEFDVALDPNRPEQAYHIGRLFAIYQHAQERSGPVAASIKKLYFGKAKVNPSVVMSRIAGMAQPYLDALEGPSKFFFDRRIESIFSNVEKFPVMHTPEQQGAFVIGYYHELEYLAPKPKAGGDGAADEPDGDGAEVGEEELVGA